MATKTIWTKEQDNYLRENYGKLSYREMKEYLPYGVQTIANRAKTIGIIRKRGPKEACAVPLERALTPKQAPVMRTFLRLLVYYTKHNDASPWDVIQGFRDTRGGRVRRRA